MSAYGDRGHRYSRRPQLFRNSTRVNPNDKFNNNSSMNNSFQEFEESEEYQMDEATYFNTLRNNQTKENRWV